MLLLIAYCKQNDRDASLDLRSLNSLTDMNSQPKISVVTVCFNSGKTIENTIKSMLAQTYNNFEYWIIDGTSKDNTIQIIQRYESLFCGKLRYISERDSGIYNAINKGIRLCTGDMVGILNSDDYYSPDTLEIVAGKYVELGMETFILIGNMMRVSQSGEPIYTYRFKQSQVESKSCFGHPSMFAAKKVYDLIGLYDESFKLAADGEWQYRALENEHVSCVLCSSVFNHMREGGASDNYKNRWKWFRERVRMKQMHGRGSDFTIYLQEFFSLIRTDIKTILPSKLSACIYKIRYK